MRSTHAQRRLLGSSSVSFCLKIKPIRSLACFGSLNSLNSFFLRSLRLFAAIFFRYSCLPLPADRFGIAALS
jgi:hypothetical protein